MVNDQQFRLAGWAAYASAALFALDGLVSSIVFSSGAVLPGTHSHSILVESLDVLSSLAAFLFAFTLYLLLRPLGSRLALWGLEIGVVGGIYMTVLHLLFVFEVVWFSDAIVLFLLGIAAWAIWVITVAHLTGVRGKPALNAILILFAIIVYPIWAIWVGRRIIAGEFAQPVAKVGVP